jgi:hypothetical protein
MIDIAAIKARAEAGEWYYHHEVMALIAALEASEAARVKAEQERDAARGKHFKSTIHNGVSAQFLKHDAKRITVLEQERDALKEALKSRDEANAAIHNQEPER